MRDVTLRVASGTAGVAGWVWHLEKAWPTRLHATPNAPSSDEMTIEKLILTYDTLSRR